MSLTDFLHDAETKAFDAKHRRTLNYNIGQYDKKVDAMRGQFTDIEQARRLAKNAKWNAVEHLDRSLADFERHFTARGGRVIWAENARQACQAVLDIAKERGARAVVKSKSMVTEEIELNHFLEANGIESLETDLGEYIVQISNDRPYHIITPIMHLSKEDVADIFEEKFDLPPHSTPTEVTLYVREKLRSKYAAADIGITGGNFLLADTGTVVVTENEGNARLSTALPKVHIAIVGIEKVLPSIRDLALMLPLLSTFGTGQRLTVYNTLLSGPKQPNEPDGPEEMYVILLDNGRTNLLADPVAREALFCIRCGACLNGCPIYKNVGGHTYESVYSGPIGAVIEPHLTGFKERGYLSDASSLCGNCSAVCPVHINLHHILLHNRQKAVSLGTKKREEGYIWRTWEYMMLHRAVIDLPTTGMKRWGFRQFVTGLWGSRRALPTFPKYSFNELWERGDV